MNIRRILSTAWRWIRATFRWVRRHPMATLVIIVIVQFLCILQTVGQLNKRDYQAVQQQQQPQSQVGQQQAAPAQSAIPTLSPSLVVPVGQYDIFVTGTTGNPKGTLAYGSASTCGGGCGSFKGTVGLRGIRVVDNSSFVVDVDISIIEISGDPWLFQGDLGDIRFEVNGQLYRPVASSFSSQVTGVATFSGYLTFIGQIPLADPTSSQYKVVLRMPTRMAQPIEGWLSPH